MSAPTNPNVTYNRNSDVSVTRAVSVLNLIAGIWLIISPFILGFSGVPAALWSAVVVGVIVLVFSWIRAANPNRYMALSGLNLLLGFWSIVSPYLLRFSGLSTPTANAVILGAIVLVLAIWSIATSWARPGVARTNL
jgi:hypothetical protein